MIIRLADGRAITAGLPRVSHATADQERVFIQIGHGQDMVELSVATVELEDLMAQVQARLQCAKCRSMVANAAAREARYGS